MRAQPVLVTRRFPSGQYTESTNTANILSEIYRVWVPRGYVWMIDPERPVNIFLATQETKTAPGDHSAVALTYPIARVLQPDGGYTDGDFQEVVLKADGTKRTISAVADHVDSWDSPTITCSDETAADHVYSYVPAEDGELVVKVEAPRGQGTLAYPILTRNTKSLHIMNQHRDLRLPSTFPLPPDFAIVFYLKAAWQVAWDNGATSGSANLQWCKIQFWVRQLPEREFFEAKEPRPGYNLRKRVEDLMANSVR